LQERQGASNEIGAFHQKPAHLPHRRLKASDLEQHHRLRRLLHLVDGVVHRRDQAFDVATVERGDKGAPHRGQHLARDIVGIVLELVDALAVHGGFVAAAQHALQGLRALGYDGGVTGKKVEEPLLLWQEGSKPTHHTNKTLKARGGPRPRNRSVTNLSQTDLP